MTSIVDRTTTLEWNSINVGDEVTPMDVPVTTTLIVAGAIASRDYMPVHHDRDFANSQGSKDIFLNILTTNGLCVKFLHDWAGPEAMVKKLSIRLGVPAYPNDPMRFTGSSRTNRPPMAKDLSRSLSRAPTASATTSPELHCSACSKAWMHERRHRWQGGPCRDRPDRVLQGIRPQRNATRL